MAEGQEAEDKTQDASERRIEKALESGDVARSADLGAFLTLAAGGLAASATLTLAGPGLKLDLARLLAGIGQPASTLDPGASGLKALSAAGGFLAAPLLAACFGAVAASFIMHRFMITTEPLSPKLSRISPASGAKRILSSENLIQFAKTLAKLALSGAVLWALWHSAGAGFLTAGFIVETGRLGDWLLHLCMRVFWSLLGLFAVLAMADAAHQRFAWLKRLRMSHQEVKEEHKESDGSPETKQRVRQIQRQRARRRMMAAVPKATVIITNPTHFAVALRYEKGMAAPICLAKGVDEVAAKIREIAREHRIPLVENPPLARALHATASLDEPIPVEHYKAVAEIIGHILRLARQRR